MMVSLPEKMIRKCFGVRRRSREQKKVILRKRCKAHFLDIMGRKRSVCGYVMCSRNHGVKKGYL